MELVLMGAQCVRTSNYLVKQTIEGIESIKITKEKKPYIYLEVVTELDQDETIKRMNKCIKSNPVEAQFIFKIYGFFEGKIDVAGSLSAAAKRKK